MVATPGIRTPHAPSTLFSLFPPLELEVGEHDNRETEEARDLSGFMETSAVEH